MEIGSRLWTSANIMSAVEDGMSVLVYDFVFYLDTIIPSCVQQISTRILPPFKTTFLKFRTHQESSIQLFPVILHIIQIKSIPLVIIGHVLFIIGAYRAFSLPNLVYSDLHHSPSPIFLASSPTKPHNTSSSANFLSSFFSS